MKEQIAININEKELRRLPKEGPFICVANRLLDGVAANALQTLFEKVGGEYQLISNRRDALKEVDLGSSLQPAYFQQLLETLKKAKEDKVNVALLLNFSSNPLEGMGKRRRLNQTMKVLRQLELPIVPIRLITDVHPFFHSGIRAKILKRTTQDAIQVNLRIGNPIRVEDQARIVKNSRLRKYVQSKVFALGSDLEVKRFFSNPFLREAESEVALAAAIDPALIEKDIQGLRFENLIAAQSDYDILVAAAHQIPNVLMEIGRLRELTFRAVGEGTGKASDLDEFDLYYDHLIIWDRVNKQLVGGYRMGRGDEIFSKYGLEGFYIHSLFKVKAGFFPIMRQSVELGRSYIVPAYQRKRLPLFLLWKGILYFLLKNPEYRYLFGPVSISKYYSNVSKGLIISFIEKFYFNRGLAQYLSPRKPFKFKTQKVDINVLLENMDSEMKNLDSLVEDIEPQHFRIPVLFRQYLKLNARFISFNVDPNFSDCLDGFILLDLNDVPLSMLEALKKEV